MAIVTMKRLRAIALAASRDALLLELQRLGCVQLSAEGDGRDEPLLAERYAPDHGDLTERYAQRQLLREAIGVLDRYAARLDGFRSALRNGDAARLRADLASVMP